MELSHSLISKNDPNPSSDNAVPGNDVPERSLFGPEPVRVRDLIGDISVPSAPVTERSFTSAVVVTPARRGGRLTLSWYDYGVVALIGASLIAGIICLLHGV